MLYNVDISKDIILIEWRSENIYLLHDIIGFYKNNSLSFLCVLLLEHCFFILLDSLFVLTY